MLMTWQLECRYKFLKKKNIFVYFALLDERILAVYCTNIDEYCLKQSAISRKSLKMPKVLSEAINRWKTYIRMGKTTNNGRRKTTQKTKVRVSWILLKTGCETRYSARDNRIWSTSDTRRATVIRNEHKFLWNSCWIKCIRK